MIKEIKKHRLCKEFSKLLDEYTKLYEDVPERVLGTIFIFWFSSYSKRMFLSINDENKEFVLHIDNIIKMQMFPPLDNDSIIELIVKKYNKNNYKVILK